MMTLTADQVVKIAGFAPGNEAIAVIDELLGDIKAMLAERAPAAPDYIHNLAAMEILGQLRELGKVLPEDVHGQAAIDLSIPPVLKPYAEAWRP